MVFTIKIMGFSCQFSRQPIHWIRILEFHAWENTTQSFCGIFFDITEPCHPERAKLKSPPRGAKMDLKKIFDNFVTKSRRRSCRSPASWPQWSVTWSVTSHILPCWSSASKACSLWTMVAIPRTSIYPWKLGYIQECWHFFPHVFRQLEVYTGLSWGIFSEKHHF